MPWKASTQVQARVRFIEDWLSKEYESLAALCRVHGVSRKTGYKWCGAVLERTRRLRWVFGTLVALAVGIAVAVLVPA